VRRFNVVSTHHERPAGVARRFQVLEHLVGCSNSRLLKAASSDARHVLSNDPTGSEFANESGELGPQVTLVLLGLALSRDRVRLAGEAADDGVDSLSHKLSCAEPSNVVMDGHPRPVRREHFAGERLDLAECDRAKPTRALEAEADPADPAEQVEDGEHSRAPHEPVRLDLPRQHRLAAGLARPVRPFPVERAEDHPPRLPQLGDSRVVPAPGDGHQLVPGVRPPVAQ
jgi:hypothetical protein